MKKILINPFLMFGFTFLFVIFSFNLELSGLYKGVSSLSINLLFSIFIITSLIIGVIVNYSALNRCRFNYSLDFLKPHKTLSIAILMIGFVAECYNNGGVPLVMVLKGMPYDYTQFGIKTFHVFYMSYLSASTIVNYERFLKTKRKYFLIPAALGIMVTVLIMNRGATLLLVFPMFLMTLFEIKGRLKIRTLVLFFTVGITFIIMFGVLGDKRMLASGYQDENIIMKIGEASPIFEKLPSGFFWTYLYSTSPYANLLLQLKEGNVNQGYLDDYVAGVMLPDFVSKYTNPEVTSKYELFKITPELNVATGFSMALILSGIAGVIFLYLWLLFFNSIFIFINNNYYLLSVCANLSAINIFMCFNNMLIFSSCVLQLLLITIFARVKLGRYLVL